MRSPQPTAGEWTPTLAEAVGFAQDELAALYCRRDPADWLTLARGRWRLEIRDYPSLTSVSTEMGNYEMDGSLMRLFRFITGKNEVSKKIQ